MALPELKYNSTLRIFLRSMGWAIRDGQEVLKDHGHLQVESLAERQMEGNPDGRLFAHRKGEETVAAGDQGDRRKTWFICIGNGNGSCCIFRLCWERHRYLVRPESGPPLAHTCRSRGTTAAICTRSYHSPFFSPKRGTARV